MLQQKMILMLAICLLIMAGMVFGQGTTGSISGTVTDPNGALVPNAAVKVANIATGFTREGVSSADGSFSFQLLPAGTYSVEITATNFALYKGEAVVNITQTTTVDAVLSVSGGSEIVNVQAPLAQVETSQNGRVVSGETLKQLPLPTRNFQQLLALSPGAQTGVTNSTDLGRGDATISVNGQRTTSNSVRINGIDANSIGTNSTPNIAVPATDSLQEFVVQTTLYDASNGRNSGGIVEAITKSGSNDYHGSIYYFLRNKSLNANEPFIKARGIERPVATRNQFGGTFGGPVLKEHVFFFGSYQGTNEKNGVSLVNSLTTPLIPSGLRDDNRTAAGLSATFGVPLASISPIAVNILNARLPNGQFAIASSGVTGTSCTPALPCAAIAVPQSGVSTFKENQANLNGDFIFSSNHSLAAKFFIADNPTTHANYNFAGSGNGERQLIGFGGDLTIKQKLYSITDNYVFSSNIVNQAKFGFNRLRVTSVPEEPFTAAQLGISSPLASLFPGAPTIRVLGADSQFFFGSGTLADQSSRINGYNFGDTLSITHGNHRVRIGAEYRASTVKFYFNAFSRGQLLFTSFSNFLLGSGTSLLGSGVFDREFRVKDFGGFIQDDWKVSDRLTVNLGLRYDLYGLPSEKNGRLVNFLPDQAVIGTTASPAGPPNGFVQASGGPLANVPQVTKTLVPVDKNNFSPRIGFAYSVNDSVVVRGGYGIYYDRISTRYANTQLFNYPYFALGVGLPGLGVGQTFAAPYLNMPVPSSFPTAATTPSPLTPLAFATVGVPIAGVYVDPNLSTPWVQQYTLGVQWQVAKSYLIDVGYVGSRGRNLLQVVTLNQPFRTSNNVFISRYPATVISANKNATGGLQQVQTTSLSYYDSFQASLTKRFSTGLQFLAAYTYGKSTDYYSGAALNELTNMAGDQVFWQNNKGPSDFNRKQRFVISGVYNLPKFKFDSGFAKAILNDWQVAGIAVIQSGLPFSIVNSNDTSIISRANYATGFSGNSLYTTGSASSRTLAYFNTAAFARSCITAACSTALGAVTNPAFDPNAPFGNTPRNFLVGPGQKNVDVSFIKLMPFTDNVRGEFRAEMFNVFNWVNYANPNNNLIGANFGRIERAASGPRVIQLAFKLSF